MNAPMLALVIAALLIGGCGDKKAPAKAAPTPDKTAKVEKTPARVAKKAKPKLGPPAKDQPLKPFTGDDDEVELFSAAITAVPCAKGAAKTGVMGELSLCSPRLAATRGIALVDPQEKGVYLIDDKSIYAYELEQGFKGAIDISGTIVGLRGGIPVIKPEEYTIRPKPKAGAFKGCL
ncbi:MAG: hypothetical protein KC502_02430 [Myxococcales bacterium]|nr:hypothetical protein [Myxococcales bacterium]